MTFIRMAWKINSRNNNYRDGKLLYLDHDELKSDSGLNVFDSNVIYTRWFTNNMKKVILYEKISQKYFVKFFDYKLRVQRIFKYKWNSLFFD